MKLFRIAIKLFSQVLYAGIKGPHKRALLTGLVKLHSSWTNLITQGFYVAYIMAGVVMVSVLFTFLSSWTSRNTHYSRLFSGLLLLWMKCLLHTSQQEWLTHMHGLLVCWGSVSNSWGPERQHCHKSDIRREICSAAFADTLAQFSMLSLTMTSN